MGVVTDILAFVVAIGVLVTVHEFGHFWVARRLGVRVLRFSVGFGRALWSRTAADGTEYVVAAIPLGGYVKMLDEREAEVPESELAGAFNRKPLWVRNAVIVAGPAFNLLFAVVAYWAVFVIGTQEMRPIIGEVAPESPAAQAGLESGDELVAVGGRETLSWDSAVLALIDQAVGSDAVRVTVETESGGRSTHTLTLEGSGLMGADGNVLQDLGLQPWVPRIDPRIDRVIPGSAAEAAGLRPGERVVAVDGEPVEAWDQLVALVRDHPGETLELGLVQGGERREVNVTLGRREGARGPVGVLGVTPEVPEGLLERLRRNVQYGPLAAVPEALQSTWQATSLTLKLLVKMVVGEASVKNLSGPINIAQFAGDSASLGVTPFLKFLAIVSISLAVLNLLPVPILDGGHLLYNAIEWVRGRPLSEQAQGLGQQIGLVMLGLLMALVFYNDLARLFGPH